jgi:IS30 family transposase
MTHITKEQRYTLERLLAKRMTQKEIGGIINKDKSVISREISRNKDPESGEYRADLAQEKYENRQEEKVKHIRFTPAIQAKVEELIKEEYSPDQARGTCLDEGLPCVSNERIYQHIWEDKRKGGILYTFLRRKGRKYRKRGAAKDSRGIIKNRIGIEERPEIVEKKERFGDLEIDTIIGKNHKGAIVTINDRASGYLWMGKVERRTAKNVANVARGLLLADKEFIKTITADNGKEFANHEDIAKYLDLDFYFARPYHSWERGANENLNGLIRQYIPKKTDFETVDYAFVKHVQNKLNDRPRKRFNYKSPAFIKNKLLANSKVALVT